MNGKMFLMILALIWNVRYIYVQESSSPTALEQKTTQQVQIEEYVPRVIIEGKWGTAPGEFGTISPMSAEYRGLGNNYAPRSLAVNSKGEIYILDHINNRIQKFTNEGKYILSIPVAACVDENGNSVIKTTQFFDEETKTKGTRFDIVKTPSVVGINIVIDSQDNLYYYCVKRDKGEVWWFRNDKLKKKWEVPVHGGIYYEAPLGLFLEDDDSIWIFNVQESGKKTKKHYEIKEKKKYTSDERNKKLEEAKEKSKEQKFKKITPSDRLKQFDFEVTDEGVRVIRRYETK